MKKFIVILAGISTLALAGCISQEQADTKMGAGCQAALQAQMGPDKAKDIKVTGAAAQVTTAGEFRKVDMTYVPDSFDTTPQPASCLFSEQWGPAKTSHTALLEQLVIGNTVYGKQDGAVQGSLDDFLKLTDAASRAMQQ